MKQQLIFSVLIFCCFCLQAQKNVNYYIEEGKKNSPLIRDAQNQSKANTLEIERLKAFYTKPQIGVSVNYLFSPILSLDNNQTRLDLNTAGAGNYVGYDLAISNSGLYQALLTVNQPLFNARKLQTASEQSKVTSLISQNQVKLSGHDLEKFITDQYILCVQDSKQLSYSKTMLDLLASQKIIILKLAESNIYKQSDLTLLGIEQQNFQLQYTGFLATYKRDVQDLNILCGISDTSFVEINAIDLKISQEATQSLFLEKYRLDSLSLVSSKKIVELKYRPQFNVFANTGLNAVYAPTLPNRFGLSAGFSFVYNFFDGGQKKINTSKTDVLMNSVSYYKESFQTQNSVRKNKVINELASYNARIAISKQQIDNYDYLLGLYRKEILTGQLSIINYMTTIKNMAAMQRDYAIIETQKQLLINLYNYWNW